MWFGTDNGLSKYTDQAFVTLPVGNPSDAFNPKIQAIYRDLSGLLWLGIPTGALLYDGRVWSQLDTRDGFTGNVINDIYPDTDGALWFATDGGVTRYRRGRHTPGIRIVSVKTDRVHTDLSAFPPMIAGEGMPVGMMPSVAYCEVEHQLQSGDIIVFMTDGVIEAHDGERNEYQDTGRLQDVMARFTLEMSASGVIEALIADVLDFSGSKTEPEDDMTVVVVKVQ